MTSGEFGHEFTLAPADLKRLIEKTQFAISSEETRYYLNGIFVHIAEVEGRAMLRAVATDGHRLARLEMPAPAGLGRNAGRHRCREKRSAKCST